VPLAFRGVTQAISVATDSITVYLEGGAYCLLLFSVSIALPIIASLGALRLYPICRRMAHASRPDREPLTAPIRGGIVMLVMSNNRRRGAPQSSGAKPHVGHKTWKVAIVGLPNTGKSQIFSNLSGTYSVVANYPLTTVVPKRATRTVRGRRYEFIDTPGLHCINIHSEEELQVRNLLFSEPPDVLLQCIDANRLRQSLELTLDLTELGIPLVISLNAIDETQRNGLVLHSRELASFFGVPVIESVAPEGRGTEELLRAIESAGPPTWRPLYGAEIEEAIAGIEATLPEGIPFPRKTAELLLLGDEHIERSLRADRGEEAASAMIAAAEAGRARVGGNVPRVFRGRRDKLVDMVTSRVAESTRRVPGPTGHAIASLARHPFYGILILAVIVVVVYAAVVKGAGSFATWLGATIEAPIVDWIRSDISSSLLVDFLVGDFGLLTLGLFNAFLTVLPILGVFYIIMGLLEDVGYLPNITVLMRKALGRIGLSGQSVMSLVLGFGCKTMAALTTRGVTSRRERIIANFLIAFAIPCSAQLALDMTILGRTGFAAFLIAVGFLALVELGAGAVLNRLLPAQPVMEYIQELPAIRIPRISAVLLKTGHRLLGFLGEALPIFLIASVALFALDRLGVLHALEAVLRPIVVGWLGLPIRMVEVLILSLARHEAAAGLLLSMVTAGDLSFTQAVTSVAITTMFVPCVANIVAMCKVLGTKRGLAITAAVNVASFVLAGVLRWAIAAVLALT
jgi:ferrous iron transport protein B